MLIIMLGLQGMTSELADFIKWYKILCIACYNSVGFTGVQCKHDDA